MYQDLIYFIFTTPLILLLAYLIKKFTRDKILAIFFAYVIISFIAIALFEVGVETGTNTYGFFGKLRSPLYISLNTSQYHFWLFWIFSGIVFILFPFGFFLLVKFKKVNLKTIFSNLKYLAFLIGVYYIGLTLEDFTWHITHPSGVLALFNTDFVFHKWVNIGFLIPEMYLWQLAVGFLFLFLSLYKNGEIANKLGKTLKVKLGYN